MTEGRKIETVRERHERIARALIGNHNLGRGAVGSPPEWIAADDDAVAEVLQALTDAFWDGIWRERNEAKREAELIPW